MCYIKWLDWILLQAQEEGVTVHSMDEDTEEVKVHTPEDTGEVKVQSSEDIEEGEVTSDEEGEIKGGRGTLCHVVLPY